MNFTHFLEILLNVLLIAAGLMAVKYANTEKARMGRVLIATHCV